MSQIEQEINLILSKRPEIEKCLQEGLINRRSLARYLIKEGAAKGNQLEAVIATLRRFNYKTYTKQETNLFKEITIRIKDNITVYDFEKDKKLLQALKTLMDKVNYDKGQTLKIVVGTESIKVFVDAETKLTELKQRFHPRNFYKSISEISIIFPEKAIETKGIVSFVTKQLYLHDVLITELLTATPELLIYVKDKYTVKAYEILKDL